MNNQTATPVRGQALRERVLNTALRLFTADGFFNTSIHDIRREADVSIGSIYHHFSSKESLARALYDDLLARMRQDVEQIITRHDNCHDRCRAIVAMMLNHAEHEPEMMRFILYAKHREFMPDQPPICSSRPFGLMREVVQRGIEAGEVRRMDPWVAATAVFGGAIRMMQLRLDGVLKEPLPGHLDEVWECAWRAVRNEDRAGSEATDGSGT